MEKIDRYRAEVEAMKVIGTLLFLNMPEPVKDQVRELAPKLLRKTNGRLVYAGMSDTQIELVRDIVREVIRRRPQSPQEHPAPRPPSAKSVLAAAAKKRAPKK